MDTGMETIDTVAPGNNSNKKEEVEMTEDDNDNKNVRDNSSTSSGDIEDQQLEKHNDTSRTDLFTAKENENDDEDAGGVATAVASGVCSYWTTKWYSVPCALREIFGAGSTKLFFGGFLWQAFAFLCLTGSSTQPPDSTSWKYPDSTSWIYAVATGSGDALGVFLGNMLSLWLESLSRKHCTINSNSNNIVYRIVPSMFTPSPYPGHNTAVRDSLAVGIGAFVSGFAWQPLVNVAASSLQLGFTTAMVFVGGCCGVLFFLGYAVGIYVCLRRSVWHHNLTYFLRDVSLAVGVMGSAAFFVGTDMTYPNNWLVDIVGERDGTVTILNCLKAGFSTFLGFMVMSLVVLLLVPNNLLWMTQRT